MTPMSLYERLKPIQEAKGYYFNPDSDYTMPLLEALITNMERYGYMACPCRLASGDFDADRDIVCPCVYREPDVAEFGACYCALYVSEAVKDGTSKAKPVPERRTAAEAQKALGLSR